jgi:DNA-binding NarL/FixJ family response regulator
MRSKSLSPEPPAKRRILIVDDHPLLRRGLTALINNESDLTVCAEAATQRGGMEAVASTQPDLVIADLSLGDGDGLALVKEIRSDDRKLPVLVFSMHDTPAYAQRVFQAGANGYVTKQEIGEALLIAIRNVLAGEKYVSPKLRPGIETT